MSRPFCGFVVIERNAVYMCGGANEKNLFYVCVCVCMCVYVCVCVCVVELELERWVFGVGCVA